MKVFYNANDNLLEVQGVRRKNDSGQTVYDTAGAATVTVTVKNPSGVNLSGQSWPFTLSFVAGSDGNFQGTLQDTLDTTGLTWGLAHIEIEWAGLKYVDECPIQFQDRQCCPELVEAPEPEEPAAVTELDIIDLASSPKQVSGDEGSVMERSVSEYIEADRYAAAKAAGQGGAPFGMRVSRIKPGGTVAS